MAKVGSETKTILRLILKLAEERVNNEIDKSVDAQNKASFLDTHKTHEFYKGKVDGLRYAMDCFRKAVSEIEG